MSEMRTIDSVDVVATETDEEVTYTEVYCPNCGEIYPVGMERCDNCGAHTIPLKK